MRRLLLGLAALALPAQEFSVAAGPLHGVGLPGRTYSWRVGYAQAVSPQLAFSFGWLNEGHLPGHHRDGPTLMAWRIIPVGDEPRMRLAFGAGLYRTYDTEDLGHTYANLHALKGILSATLQMPLADTPWGVQTQLSRTILSNNQDTRTLTLGMTYSFRKADAAPRSRLPERGPACQAVTLYYGTAILNSQVSQNSEGFALEYRRRWSEHMDWSLTYADEGDLELLRRDSLALQVWATSAHLGHRLILGVGLGPTLCYSLPPAGHTKPVSTWGGGVRITMAGAWRMSEGPWQVKASWSRMRAPNNRDTDLIATGLGLAF